jgi:hypothetical protein
MIHWAIDSSRCLLLYIAVTDPKLAVLCHGKRVVFIGNGSNPVGSYVAGTCNIIYLTCCSKGQQLCCVAFRDTGYMIHGRKFSFCGNHQLTTRLPADSLLPCVSDTVLRSICHYILVGPKYGPYTDSPISCQK